MPNPICPTDCSSALPIVNFDKCNPQVAFSEIRRIFLAKETATPFTDWRLAPEWVTRISETDVVDDDTIRPLSVIADKPAPASIVVEISNGRNYTVGKDHTINYTIDDISELNYEFMRNIECGGKYKMWYETEGGFMYGGNEGISVTLTGDDILNRGRTEIETIAGAATWRNKFHPERTLSPIFDSDYSQPVTP